MLCMEVSSFCLLPLPELSYACSFHSHGVSLVTGPYIKRIIIDELGGSPESCMNAEVLPDFGG